jgi:uncharacterized membrane protein (DUF4010 family)
MALGLLIGSERERSHRGHEQRAGARTFALVGLCGALSASFAMTVVAAGTVAVVVLLVVLVRPEDSDDPGATTALAMLSTFLLGALAWEQEHLALALAILVTALLMAKQRIHRVVREVLSADELADALRFAVIAVVVLPVLPDRSFGPFAALNPQRIWLAVVAFVTVSWIGYIAVRAVGPRRGAFVAGFAGGFVSATATTATMAGRYREGSPLHVSVSAALFASVATFVQLIGVLAVIDPELAGRMVPACVISALVLTAVAAAGMGRGSAEAPIDPNLSMVSSTSPPAKSEDLMSHPPRAFSLRAALLFAAGLADAHAGALAAATVRAQGEIDLATAAIAVSMAIAANLLVKTVLAFALGGRAFGHRFARSTIPVMIIFVLMAAVAP